MDQNVFECKDSIRKIKKKLENNGYNIINVGYDILCKSPKKQIQNQKNALMISNNTSANISKFICPVNSGGCIDSDKKSCTYSGTCTIDNNQCPLHGNKNDNNLDDSENNENNSNINCSNSDYLFRIRPTDIYNGIFFHAIILYKEHCDLKMTFNYDDDGINQLIDVINFLVG